MTWSLRDLFSWLLYVIGLFSLLIIPYHLLHQTAEFSEKAIMPGYLVNKFTGSHLNKMNDYGTLLDRLANQNSEQRLAKVMNELLDVGLYVHEQHYAYDYGGQVRKLLCFPLNHDEFNRNHSTSAIVDQWNKSLCHLQTTKIRRIWIYSVFCSMDNILGWFQWQWIEVVDGSRSIPNISIHLGKRFHLSYSWRCSLWHECLFGNVPWCLSAR